MEQPSSPPEESVSLSRMTGDLSTLRERPTFTQMFGARLLRILLWFICGLVVVFLLVWVFTLPTFAQVQAILGSSTDPKTVLETFRELRRDHFEHVQRLFQLLVLSGLIPLVTLFAGYTFGSRESERTSPAENAS
jgi:hypothetical protein